MLDRDEDIKVQQGSVIPSSIRNLSQFFYHKSSVVMAVVLTVITFGYLFFVMKAQSVGFELADSNIKSLGTSFGFGQTDVTSFFAARTDEMINAYIDFNQLWDPLFGLMYGFMYVTWVSLVFKPFSQKAGLLNLFPFAQVVFDWLENFEVISLANQYLAEGVISATTSQLASVFSMIKWACSGMTYMLILIGLILLSARAIMAKKGLPRTKWTSWFNRVAVHPMQGAG